MMMSQAFHFNDFQFAPDINVIAGWRQWADAGSVSSGLIQYLIDQTQAVKIGTISPDGFYFFQIPGTHDLVRPVIKFETGLPRRLETPRNEFFYSGNVEHGLVLFLGDEPHLDGERYVSNILEAAKLLHARRIIGLGGVYGEFPYDKDRMISAIYSQKQIKKELKPLAVSFSNYEGGASIESYLCKRAGEQKVWFAGLYAFVPSYEFTGDAQTVRTIRLENDFTAWLNIMQRVNYLLNLAIDLTDLEFRSQQLHEAMRKEIEEIDRSSPEQGVLENIKRISEEFTEMRFAPSEDFWEEKLRGFFDRLEGDESNDLTIRGSG